MIRKFNEISNKLGSSGSPSWTEAKWKRLLRNDEEPTSASESEPESERWQ